MLLDAGPEREVRINRSFIDGKMKEPFTICQTGLPRIVCTDLTIRGTIRFEVQPAVSQTNGSVVIFTTGELSYNL